jgi:HK97 gp10 family phage protein
MIKLKVTGFRELERALAEELPKATAVATMRRAALKSMEPLEIQARVRAPKESGYLARSITSQVQKAKFVSRNRRARTSGVSIYTGPSLFAVAMHQITKVEGGYAAWQEFGTANMPANPYMRPAYDAAKETVVEILRDTLATEIAKSKKRIAQRAAKKKA